MADISFLVFHDDRGYYRLESVYPDNQIRVDMIKDDADAWISAQAEPTLQERPYCGSAHEPHLIKMGPRKLKHGRIHV